MEKTPGSSEVIRTPETRFMATLPITGREDLVLRDLEDNRVMLITKFICRGNLADPEYGNTEKEYGVIVAGNVGHYENGGVVDVFETFIVNKQGTRSGAPTAIVRKPEGKQPLPGIFIT